MQETAKKVKRVKPAGRVFISMVPLGFGIVAIFAGLKFLRISEESSSWLSAGGVITRSTAVERRERTSTGTRKPRSYWPVWEFEYEVEGKRYTSNRVAIGEASWGYADEEEAEAAAQGRYTVGSQVTVFYDPQDPSSATLERGRPSSDIGILFAVGAGLVLLALVLPFVLP